MPDDAPRDAREPRKSGLSAARRRLIELCQEIQFGRIERLMVRDGEPVWTPPPRVLRDIRLGKGNGPHPMRAADDFALKNEVAELLGFLDRERTFTVELIEVLNGLPNRLVIATESGS